MTKLSHAEFDDSCNILPGLKIAYHKYRFSSFDKISFFNQNLDIWTIFLAQFSILEILFLAKITTFDKTVFYTWQTIFNAAFYK